VKLPLVAVPVAADPAERDRREADLYMIGTDRKRTVTPRMEDGLGHAAA
jgi:hypothetical protein